ncbi:MAG: dihydrofolate reductase family protein [Armatimonadetes bacterium]|nr:dihydrofolate reductase family protein [Armatimonadota bacterium]
MADDFSTSAVEREASRLINTIDKVVISDSLASNDTKPWQDSTRIVRRADSYESIVRLKKEDGRDILVFGSRVLWNDLLGHGLVDELHVMIAPVVLGVGTPMFGSRLSAPFRLLDAQTWSGSGLVLARYEVLGDKM